MLMIFILFLVGGSGILSPIFLHDRKTVHVYQKKKKVSRGLTLLNVYDSVDIGPVNTSLRDHEQRFG